MQGERTQSAGGFWAGTLNTNLWRCAMKPELMMAAELIGVAVAMLLMLAVFE